MTELTIRAIPDETFAAFAAHASRRGHSVEGAVLELMHAAANEETLMQALEKASRAAEDIEILVPTGATVTPQPRRRYRSVKPAPIRSRP